MEHKLTACAISLFIRRGAREPMNDALDSTLGGARDDPVVFLLHD